MLVDVLVEESEVTVAKILTGEQMNVYGPLWYEEESGFRYHGMKGDAEVTVANMLAGKKLQLCESLWYGIESGCISLASEGI